VWAPFVQKCFWLTHSPPCSVIAAANPVYGQYDKLRRPQDNIGLPDSLLSRFDLLFIVLDQLNPENDRRISAHVLRGHRYRKPGTDMAPEPLQAAAADSDDEEDEEKRTVVWQRSHHSENNGKASDDDHSDDVLSQDFLRKYIFYAKKKIQPELTEEAREYIANRYAHSWLREYLGEERPALVCAGATSLLPFVHTARAMRVAHCIFASGTPRCGPSRTTRPCRSPPVAWRRSFG